MLFASPASASPLFCGESTDNFGLTYELLGPWPGGDLTAPDESESPTIDDWGYVLLAVDDADLCVGSVLYDNLGIAYDGAFRPGLDPGYLYGLAWNMCYCDDDGAQEVPGFPGSEPDDVDAAESIGGAAGTLKDTTTEVGLTVLPYGASAGALWIGLRFALRFLRG